MSALPSIHSICVVKNESDIISLCLQRALQWSENIILYDGESTDGTWDVICSLAKDNPRIIPWRQDGKPFQESLRAEVFNEFRHLAKHGDWWCHLDADEFYIDNPQHFLARVRRPYDVVWGLFIEYYLTQSDIDTIDFRLPIEQLTELLRHYRIQHAEPRFFRHRDRLVWEVQDGWPRHMGLSYPELIRFKHYKYRSPEQIQRRLDTRRDNVARGFPGWEHARSASWRDHIAAPGSVSRDHGDGCYVTSSGSATTEHLGSRVQRIVKYILHGLGVWA